MAKFWIDLGIILIGLALVGIVAAVARYLRDIRVARERLAHLGSQVIETAYGPIEYARIGEGYPVLVVHGAMGGFDQGLWLAHSFSLPDYQFISISRFGYLRSPLPADASLDSQADAFAGLLDALEIRQAAVFAASAGSTSAIRFVARYPERVSALILLSPDAPGNVQMALPPKFIFDTLLRSDFVYWALVTFFGRWVQNAIGLVPRGYVLTPEQETALRRIQLGDLPASRRIDGMVFETYTCAPEFSASVSPTSPYPLSRIETPVLVINAADDPISLPENVRALADQMPTARLFVVPDGGHFLFGHVEEVRSEIAQFLHNSVLERQNEGGMP
jgi:pimeloyl-ACP methyl ester carboxylesterase